MQSYNHLNNHVNNEDECDSRDQVMEDVFIHVFKTIFYDWFIFCSCTYFSRYIIYWIFVYIYLFYILNLYSITFLNIQRVSAKKTSDDQSPIPNPLLVTVQTLASIVSSGR